MIFYNCHLREHCVTVNLFCFVASKGGTSEYNRLCGCVSNNIQAINKNGINFIYFMLINFLSRMFSI